MKLGIARDSIDEYMIGTDSGPKEDLYKMGPDAFKKIT